MEQLNSIDNSLLWKALTNPVEALSEDAAGIEALVNNFPQSGLLRALLAGDGHSQNVKHAATYVNPAALYKLVNLPGSLPLVSARQIIWTDDPEVPSPAEEPAAIEPETIEPSAGTDDNSTEANEFVRAEDNESTKEEVINTPPVEPGFTSEDIQAVDEPDEENEEPQLISYAEENKAEPGYTLDKAEFFHQDIEDEIYDEIVSIEDITLEQLSHTNKTDDTVAEAAENTSTVEPVSHIPVNDHFVFDDSYVQKQVEANGIGAVTSKPRNLHIENQELSRYNDDTMPYSFMWWLDKTRKEYAASYQPYVFNSGPAPVAEVNTKNVVDELQQQYVENIFNLNAIEELERSTAKKGVEFNPDRKEDRIIKRFIQTEPQIKHPTGIRLDNENKAKKSSEDGDELVTETLARIYTEQMLYQKAIMAYKKLMLKFPEKSLYFASQIETLEKKSN